MIRSFFVWLHRWVGLLMASFLVIVALTGSLLAFNAELERVFAPRLFAPPRPGAPPLDLATLAERAQTLVPEAQVGYVLYAEPDQVLVTFVPRATPAGEQASYFGVLQLFLDPWTGEELGRRRRGDLSEGWINFMPFIYKLHWTLTFDSVGSTILGIVAIAWSIDCFVGLYLTLPVSLHFPTSMEISVAHQTSCGILSIKLRSASSRWSVVLAPALHFRVVERHVQYSTSL